MDKRIDKSSVKNFSIALLTSMLIKIAAWPIQRYQIANVNRNKDAVKESCHDYIKRVIK